MDKLKKNSSNSSKPPSTDIVRTKSLRISTGRKPGGQKGHTGTTLQISEIPDEVIVHKSRECSGCGKDISTVGTLRYERRQVYDIAEIKMAICEHRSEIKCCPHCQKENKGIFPAEVSHCTQYGSNLKGLAVYLTQYQLLPLGRSAQLIEDITGHSLSAATLVNINENCSKELDSFIEVLKDNLQKAPVIHSDKNRVLLPKQAQLASCSRYTISYLLLCPPKAGQRGYGGNGNITRLYRQCNARLLEKLP